MSRKAKSKKVDTSYLEDVKYNKKVFKPEDYETIKMIFAKADKDQSQKISYEELYKSFDENRDKFGLMFPFCDIEELAKDILESSDENGDNEIDLGELVKFFETQPQLHMTKGKKKGKKTADEGEQGLRSKPKREEENDWEDTEYLGDVKYNKKYISPIDYDDMKKAFSYLDKDNSKKISIDELKEELDKIKDEVKKEFPEFDYDEICKMIIEQADENGDKEIDFEEFINIMVKEPIMDIKTRENCNKIYKEFTRDGPLNKKTLTKIAKELEDNQDDEGIERMIFYADGDKDKEISEEEFYYILNPKEGQLEEMAIQWRDKDKETESKTKKKK